MAPHRTPPPQKRAASLPTWMASSTPLRSPDQRTTSRTLVEGVAMPIRSALSSADGRIQVHLAFGQGHWDEGMSRMGWAARHRGCWGEDALGSTRLKAIVPEAGSQGVSGRANQVV